ncbi:MAG: HAD family hydrolase [Bdellovibrionales bacterium]
MTYNNYSSETWTEITTRILNFINNNPGPYYAAFDADGTLWDLDIGEIVFDHHIENCNLDLPAKPWDHYRKLKAKHPPTAYLWLAQILAGKTIEEVRGYTEAAYRNYELKNKTIPIFPQQQKLFSWLHEIGVKVFIVTASIKWAVEEGGKFFNIPQERVLGVKTKLIEGKVSLEQDGPITYREGKAEAILEATGGIAPIFCAGNTLGDEHLLKCSQLVRLAVSSHSMHEELFKTESQLKEMAATMAWLTHKFR